MEVLGRDKQKRKKSRFNLYIMTVPEMEPLAGQMGDDGGSGNFTLPR